MSELPAEAWLPEDWQERWRPCSLHTAYEVSDHGRVRRIGRSAVLRPAVTDRGYVKLSLGRRLQPYVHHLVATAFHGPRPGLAFDVDHDDRDRTNNWAVNLRWMRFGENRARVRWAGRTASGVLWANPDHVADEDAGLMAAVELAEWAEQNKAAGW